VVFTPLLWILKPLVYCFGPCVPIRAG